MLNLLLASLVFGLAMLSAIVSVSCFSFTKVSSNSQFLGRFNLWRFKVPKQTSRRLLDMFGYSLTTWIIRMAGFVSGVFSLLMLSIFRGLI